MKIFRKFVDRWFPKCEDCGERHDRWDAIDCAIFTSFQKAAQRQVEEQARINVEREPKRLMEK